MLVRVIFRYNKEIATSKRSVWIYFIVLLTYHVSSPLNIVEQGYMNLIDMKKPKLIITPEMQNFSTLNGSYYSLMVTDPELSLH